MARYDFRCLACGKDFEVVCGFADYTDKQACPCGGVEVQRIYTLPVVSNPEVLPEFYQYAVKDPTKPGGYRVWPHKNKYVGGIK